MAGCIFQCETTKMKLAKNIKNGLQAKKKEEKKCIM